MVVFYIGLHICKSSNEMFTILQKKPQTFYTMDVSHSINYFTGEVMSVVSQIKACFYVIFVSKLCSEASKRTQNLASVERIAT